MTSVTTDARGRDGKRSGWEPRVWRVDSGAYALQPFDRGVVGYMGPSRGRGRRAVIPARRSLTSLSAVVAPFAARAARIAP